MAEYELKSFSFEVFVSVYNNNLTKILKSRNPVHPKKINLNKKIIITNSATKLFLSFSFSFFCFRCLQHCRKNFQDKNVCH